MLKKLNFIFMLTVLIMSFSTLPSYAKIYEHPYELDISSACESNNAVFSKDGVIINNGSASYSFTLPIYSDSITLKSNSKDASVKISIDGYFSTVVFAEESATYKFPTPLRIGEKKLVISTENMVDISSVIFKEITEEKSVTPTDLIVPEYEDAISTAIIIKENSPVITVNSAKRYLDYNDTSVCPVYYNNSLYVPAKALADALGCYFEEDKDKNFLILRKSNIGLVFLNDEVNVLNDNVKTHSHIAKTEINSQAYLPLRAVCELFGEYVLYKDGYVICDYMSRANIIADKYFDKLKEQYKDCDKSDAQKIYYVSKQENASDNNDGSFERPFLTIAKASSVASAGDIVYVRQGEYRETIIPQKNGTPGNPITYKAYENEEVLLSAMDEVSDFTKYKNNIYVASVKWDMGLGKNQVFYKNKHLIEARYPNPPIEEDGKFKFSNGLRLDPVWITQGDLKVSNKDTAKVVSDTLLDNEDDHWKNAVFITSQGAAWTLGAAMVKSSTKGELSLYNMSPKWWFGAEDKYPNYGYLTCNINCIDLPGEWTMENHMLYMMLPKDANPDNFEVSVKKRQLLVDLNDRKNIIIDGFKGFGGSVRMDNSEMCVVENCDLEYISHYTFFNDARNLYIDDGNTHDANGAPQRGEVGIYIGGENNAIVKNKIKYSAGAGLFMTGSYTYVDDNIISDCCYMGTSCGAIHMDSLAYGKMTDKRGGNTILRNTVKNVARNAISINRTEESGWSQTSFLPCEIAYNDVSDSSICTLDTGMIYMWGSNVGRNMSVTNIHNNIVYGTSPRGELILGAIYNDNYMQGTQTYDNVFFANMDNQFTYDVYEQDSGRFPTSYATVDAWNNVNLGIKKNAKKDLVAADYPSARPFKAGSSLVNEEYTMTYDDYVNGSKDIYYAADCEKSEDVKTENNRVYVTKENGYIKFNNVDFTDKEMINIMFSADYYKESDECDVIIGDSIDSKDSYHVTLKPESKNLYDITNNYTEVLAYGVTGKTNVWLKFTKCSGSGIYGITLTHRLNAYDDYEYDYKKIGGGTFTIFQKSPTQDRPKPSMRSTVDENFPIMMGTWGGGWVKYANVKIDETVTKFTVRLASGAPWDKNGINLRLGSPDGEVLARVESDDSKWEYVIKTADLSHPIKSGTYDIYLTFDGDELCSDVHYFSLGN